MKINIFLFFIFITVSSFSQLYLSNSIGIIKDKDGYSLIRKDINIKSEIVDTVFKSEFFQFKPSDTTSWYKVYKMWNINGYMHKSRIQNILDLDYKTQKSILKCILTDGKIKDGNFEFNYNNYYENIKDYESIINPAGNILISNLKQNFDEDLFKLFLDYLKRNSGSADETPPTILGYIFINSPQKVIKIMSKEKYKRVCCLGLGFGNASWDRENKGMSKKYKELEVLVNDFLENR